MTTLSSDPLIVSLVQVVTNLPLFILALPAGALTDIIDRRRFLLGSELAIMACGVALATLVSSHHISALSLLVMTALVSAAAALGAPAWQAVVSELVPRSDLPSAVSLNSLGINISRAIGPALGGFLISAYGFGVPFWIDALSNAGVIGALIWWKRPVVGKPTLPPEDFVNAMSLGVRHARYNPHLSATLVRTVAFFVFASAYWALLPVVTRAHVVGGPGIYGSLLGAIGVGAICGALVLPRIRRRWQSNTLVACCTVGTAIAMLFFAVSHEPGTSLEASVLAGMCWIGAVSSLNLSAQVALPDWVRGRGLAVFVTAMFGALTLGGLLWGALATIAGASGSLVVAAVGAVIAVPLTWRWKLQTGEGVDFTPALQWASPITTHDVDGDRGPVLVTIEYQVDPTKRDSFLKALFNMSRERKRDGAYEWKVFEDPAVDGRFVEVFLTVSWLEHLRHHSRVTNSDWLRQESLRGYIRNDPVTTHLLQVHWPQ
jgi:MFS family permease